jgi:2-oxo-hept-3-ene-1,7-dioate hydratase
LHPLSLASRRRDRLAGEAGIAWLVNKLTAVDACLEPGQIVLAGSFTRPVSVAPGDVIHADYGPLGAIGVSFV